LRVENLSICQGGGMESLIIGSLARVVLSGNANDALLPVLVVILQQVCKTFLVYRQFNTFLTLAEISLNSLTNNEGKDHASAIHYDRNAIGSGGNVGDHECR